jgi:hypothetical protein
LSWPATWGEPDEVDTIEVVRGGRGLTVTLKAWHNKLLTGDDHGRQVHRVKWCMPRLVTKPGGGCMIGPCGWR